MIELPWPLSTSPLLSCMEAQSYELVGEKGCQYCKDFDALHLFPRTPDALPATELLAWYNGNNLQHPSPFSALDRIESTTQFRHPSL